MVQETFTFCTDNLNWSVETKEEKEHFYVEGYASTADLDLVNDIVTKEAMEDMAAQCKGRAIKLDVEHESWKQGGSPNIIPVGRIIDARVDDRGLWVKAQLNPAVSRFSEVWNSITGGFLDAFSIAFTNVKGVERVIKGVKARVITGLHLLNIALTGNPANPHARLTSVMAKSLESAMIQGDTVEEENIAPAPTLEPVAEVKAVTIDDLKAMEAKIAELKSVQDENADLKAKYEQISSELKSLKEAMSAPVLKSVPAVEKKDNTPSPSMKGTLDVFK